MHVSLKKMWKCVDVRGIYDVTHDFLVLIYFVRDIVSYWLIIVQID